MQVTRKGSLTPPFLLLCVTTQTIQDECIAGWCPPFMLVLCQLLYGDLISLSRPFYFDTPAIGGSFHVLFSSLAQILADRLSL